jgi:hypothetical protein
MVSLQPEWIETVNEVERLGVKPTAYRPSTVVLARSQER